jgi:hypothetical protein
MSKSSRRDDPPSRDHEQEREDHLGDYAAEGWGLPWMIDGNLGDAWRWVRERWTRWTGGG